MKKKRKEKEKAIPAPGLKHMSLKFAPSQATVNPKS